MTASPSSDKSSSPASSRRKASAKSRKAKAKQAPAEDAILAASGDSAPPADVNASVPMSKESGPTNRRGPSTLAVWPD